MATAALICLVVAALAGDQNAGLLFTLILALALLAFQVCMFLYGLKEFFWKNRRNLLLSGFRQGLIRDRECVAVVSSYSIQTRKELVARLQAKIDDEERRLSLLIGVTRQLGVFPAIAVIYAASAAVLPEQFMFWSDAEREGSNGLFSSMLAQTGVLAVAGIIGLYIGGCAAESAIVRVKNMISCLNLAEQDVERVARESSDNA